MSDDLVTWLRRLIESDLGEWREREAHFLAVREREGDYHYFEARERVAQLEAELAILDAHDKAEHYCPIPVLPSVHGQRWTPEEGPCWTVLLLADGYRHRPGYREEWKP